MNHQDNKLAVTEYRDAWRSHLTPDELSRLRRGDDALFVELLTGRAAAGTWIMLMISLGIKEDRARHLATTPSMWFHWLTAQQALALLWLAQGGLENLAAERVSNDLIDLHYVVTAAYGRRLVTADGRTQRLYGLLGRIFDAGWA